MNNPNNTLGCGYIDEQDQIFKQTGINVERITNRLVTCLATHLTAIAVEEYAEDKKSSASSEETDAVKGQSESDEKSAENEVINMWASWAIYAGFATVGLVVVGIFACRKLDQRDEMRLEDIMKK